MSASRIKKESMRQPERDRLIDSNAIRQRCLERNRDKESRTDMLNMWCILGEGGRSG